MIQECSVGYQRGVQNLRSHGALPVRATNLEAIKGEGSQYHTHSFSQPASETLSQQISPTELNEPISGKTSPSHRSWTVCRDALGEGACSFTRSHTTIYDGCISQSGRPAQQCFHYLASWLLPTKGTGGSNSSIERICFIVSTAASFPLLCPSSSLSTTSLMGACRERKIAFTLPRMLPLDNVQTTHTSTLSALGFLGHNCDYSRHGVQRLSPVALTPANEHGSRW